MILTIKSNDENLRGAYLFQSVDYIHDSSTVYLLYEKKVGSGEAGYIFQFYQCLDEEANAFFQGLGVYLEKEFEIENIHNIFGPNHWAENNQWEWDKDNKKFITPEEMLVQDLIDLDANASLLKIEASLIEEEEKSANQIPSTTRIMNNQQQHLMQIL